MRWLVAKTLDGLSFCAAITRDGDAALLRVCELQRYAIVTDLEMRGMESEAQVAGLKRNQNPAIRNVPMIVCRSKVDPDTLAKLSAMGADAMVPKPVDVRFSH